MTKFNGTVLVVTDTSRAHEIAEMISATYYPTSSEYHYLLSDTTPEGLPTDLHDSIDAKLRDTPGGSVITVFPWANN